jgi:quercetin dioxygenase-like cupin family protein
MDQKIFLKAAFAATISFALGSCNSSGPKEANTASTDSSTVTTPAPEPAAAAIGNAVDVAPGIYKVLKDTAGIRMVLATYKPGDSAAMHSHHDYAIYTITGGKAEFTLPDGTKDVREMTAGGARVIPGDTHSVKNVGKTTVSVLLVEVDRPQSIVPVDAAKDATKVAGDLYKVKADSMGIRILEATYKPGQSSAMHAHPWQAVYPITDAMGEFTTSDGQKIPVNMKKGEVMIVAPTSHAVKNTGKATMKVLIVEVSRAEK